MLFKTDFCKNLFSIPFLQKFRSKFDIWIGLYDWKLQLLCEYCCANDQSIYFRSSMFSSLFISSSLFIIICFSLSTCLLYYFLFISLTSEIYSCWQSYRALLYHTEIKIKIKNIQKWKSHIQTSHYRV